MTLMRWTPWNELESMNRQLSRLLDGDHFDVARDAGQWAPSVDIKETDDALLVQAELSGIEKKDVHLEVKDGVLTLSGERRYEKDVKEENVHRVERAYGQFSRSFSLPSNVDAEKVEATMKDGVLEVRLPKRESAKPKSIAIH
ncbi:HSP20 family protein [Mariprofundus micogutta]|uniref:HSP20 family protein n=1 Tax=Mariprofundus micogutta TaxID=1921010 RepID=A0A1L8CQ90_9PROT|nr:Hsp20/alpha crystallin family protein [Mariprofundus micogutta]GAV21092.1 HSP20 family protein [Mariprofundus micogutta]